MSQLFRKIKRGKKTAYKFSMKLTYHAITLIHDQEYTPSGLVIRWSRGHRQVVSTKANWTPGSQPNAKGQLNGDATFEPPCTVELLVTLYKEAKSDHFDEKDYKFVLEDEGDVSGRKALGVFSINIGQFADMLGSNNEITMEMKPLVNKVSEALVAVTIKSEFLKTGKVGDDDMMSTWSAMTDRADADIEDDQADLSPDLSPGNQAMTASTSSGASRNLKESISFFDLKPEESFYEFMMRNSRDDVIDSQGTTMTLEHIRDCKVIGLFFAANSSPQCKFFLTVLDSFYNSLNEVRPRDFELLFVSCDYNDSEMLDFMQDSGVSYPGVKSSSQLAEALKEKFEISTIPEVIAISAAGKTVDKQGRLKIERCGGNEDCFDILDHWLDGKPAPVRAELELNAKSSQLSEDGEPKAKIVSKEEKKRQERLEKERKKKEEEEKRRKEKLEKEEKKRLERDEKKKVREKEKQDKRAKRSSVSIQNAVSPNIQEDITTVSDDPEIGIPDPPQITTSTEELLDNEPKTKPTLFQLAGTTPEKVDTQAAADDKPVSAKRKEKEESASFKSTAKGSDNQLREAKSRIVELEQNSKNLTENNQVLYSAKCQLENEKDDLQEKVIELTHNVEDFTEQVRDLTEAKDNLSRENHEKNQLIDTLQDQKLGLTEDLNGARGELESIRQQFTKAKLKLIEYESDKQAKDEERQQLLATTELQGWLYKRGVRGVTGKKWRRRYFHMGQGFKLYYYKTSSMQLPQGYIDLEKVKKVEPQSPDKQDKNNASFTIEVEGRVFELLSVDVSMRDQWINAVNFLVEYRSRYKVDIRTLSDTRTSSTGDKAVTSSDADENRVPGKS
ncbi:hypothetical protein LOD99_13408 [Oopsacas minuta]|uniref:protein-disulfide reductase n=1 Tax=Oopsacas minuta TaxID=111878 RepID=A0AAV7KKQ7_9METZ|nr:hypothetical protein LOD99_13408 [Oopsacas minuta]